MSTCKVTFLYFHIVIKNFLSFGKNPVKIETYG